MTAIFHVSDVAAFTFDCSPTSGNVMGFFEGEDLIYDDADATSPGIGRSQSWSDLGHGAYVQDGPNSQVVIPPRHDPQDRKYSSDIYGQISIQVPPGGATIRQVIAAWGGTLACSTHGTTSPVQYSAAPNARAIYFDPESNFATQTIRAEQLVAAIGGVAEFQCEGFIYAAFTTYVGDTYVTHPDGRTEERQGFVPDFFLAEPGSGTWRFGLRAGVDAFGPRLMLLDVPW